VLRDKLMLGRLHSNIGKKESTAKKQITLTDYVNRMFLNTGSYFN
jgi:hypothetical protein